MLILYVVVVQYINAADNLFLADTLRAVKADLADKRTVNDQLLADEVPPGTNDYFVRVLDAATKQVIAEEPPGWATGYRLRSFLSRCPKERFQRRASVMRPRRENGFY